MFLHFHLINSKCIFLFVETLEMTVNKERAHKDIPLKKYLKLVPLKEFFLI